MNIPPHPKGNKAGQPGAFAASIRIFNRFLHWLAGSFLLTEREQMDAGIYIGHQLFK